MEPAMRFNHLPEQLIFLVLDFLESDSQSTESFSLVCKSFNAIESRHRKALKPRHLDSISTATRKYPYINRLDLTNCPRIDDAVLVMLADAYSHTLKSLDLSKSRFFGQFGLLSLAGKCAGLVELDLSNATELRDSGAAAISEAQNLEKLWMARCEMVSDIGIGCIAVGCKKLKLLCLKWCVRVTDLGVGLLAYMCHDLRSLDLSYLQITKMCLIPIMQLQSLKDLTLVGCPGIDDECLMNLKPKFNSLEVLDVSHCLNITDVGLGSLTKDVKSLCHLNLAYCFSVTFDSAKYFYKLSLLLSIKLDGCQVSYPALKAIANCCESLLEFSLCKCNGVTDEGLSYVARLHRQLKKLDITCCQEITGAAVESIANYCPYLTSIRMEACIMVPNEAFVSIGRRCQFLKDIDVTENFINDEGLEAISRCSKLLNLKLGLCVDLTDCGLSHVGVGCRNLVELDLYRCTWITDVGIAAVAGGCSSLEMINMAYCDKITDTSLVSLAQYLQLKTLEIRGCLSVSSVGLCAIAKGCKKLTNLDIKKCLINDTGLIHLAQYSHNLKQINVAYCPITDDGLLALASINCLQNLTIMHVAQLTENGLIATLLACKGLMKVKMHTKYISSILDAVISEMKQHGCAIHWRNKPFFVYSSPFLTIAIPCCDALCSGDPSACLRCDVHMLCLLFKISVSLVFVSTHEDGEKLSIQRTLNDEKRSFHSRILRHSNSPSTQ